MKLYFQNEGLILLKPNYCLHNTYDPPQKRREKCISRARSRKVINLLMWNLKKQNPARTIDVKKMKTRGLYIS